MESFEGAFGNVGAFVSGEFDSKVARAAMTEQLRIKTVYIWQKPWEMVMVFDQYGQQMQSYQGPLEEVRDLILRDADENTEYYGGTWRKEIHKVPSI